MNHEKRNRALTHSRVEEPKDTATSTRNGTLHKKGVYYWLVDPRAQARARQGIEVERYAAAKS
jgi:hypothetical protein